MKRDSLQIILTSVEIAQGLIAELHRTNPDSDTFGQLGLIDGQEIVRNFVNAGELDSALDHLLYMVHEADIAFPRKIMLQLHELASAFGIMNYYSKENRSTLTPEQCDAIHNAP